MIAILGKILGSDKVISKGLDLIDSFHVSETEQIEAKNKAKIDLLNSYAPFKLAQRYLALMFGLTYLSVFVIVMFMTLRGMGDIESVKAVMGDFYIGEIMFAIVAFYFGGGAFEGVMSARKKKDV
jgi:hypothetical protein